MKHQKSAHLLQTPLRITKKGKKIDVRNPTYDKYLLTQIKSLYVDHKSNTVCYIIVGPFSKYGLSTEYSNYVVHFITLNDEYVPIL